MQNGDGVKDPRWTAAEVSYRIIEYELNNLAFATVTLVNMAYALLTALNKEDPALLGALSHSNSEVRAILKRLGYPA